MIHRIARGTRWGRAGRKHFVRCVCGFHVRGDDNAVTEAWYGHLPASGHDRSTLTLDTHARRGTHMPEAADIVVEAPKGFVTFKRSVQIRPYETATAEVMIQVPTDVGGWITENDVGDVEANVEAIIADLKPAFYAAKVAVLEQLGLSFEVDLDTLVVRELADELGAVEVSKAEVKAAESRGAAKQARPAKSGGKKFPPAPADRDEQWEELAEYPERYYDDRASKTNPNAPDFKRVEGGQGLWLKYKGKSQVPSGIELPDDGFAERAA